MPKPNTPSPESNAMEGFPADGDEFREANPNPSPEPNPPPQPQPDPLADMRSRMERIERENADLRRLIPPAEPKTTPSSLQHTSALDAIDWDKELFASPKDAIKKAISIAKEETARELRAEYQRDRGTTQFWDRFYDKHPDLKQDHDLVEITLNSNLSSLANIRVDDAYDKLAELTRDRILRYAGGAAKTRPKARAEGGGATPTQPAPQSQPKAEVTSLSDLLRSRRERRRAGAA